MTLFDFTEFLIYNKECIVDDIKPSVDSLLNKRKHFNGPFLLDYDYNLCDNIKVMVKRHLRSELSLSHLDIDILAEDCGIMDYFYNKDTYNK